MVATCRRFAIVRICDIDSGENKAKHPLSVNHIKKQFIINNIENLMKHLRFIHCTKKFLQFPADLVTFTEEILNGKLHFLCSDLNPIQDGGGRRQKGPPASFSPVMSTNVRISPPKLSNF